MILHPVRRARRRGMRCECVHAVPHRASTTQDVHIRKEGVQMGFKLRQLQCLEGKKSLGTCCYGKRKAYIAIAAMPVSFRLRYERALVCL